MKIKNPGQYTVRDSDDVVQVIGTGEGVVIRQNGGEVSTFGKSAPIIIMTDGDVSTFDTSTPVITITGGDIMTFDTSAPVIHKRNL